MKKLINFKDNGRMYFKNTRFEFESANNYGDKDYLRINGVPYEIEYTEYICDCIHKYHIRKDDRFITHKDWTIEANLYFNDFNDEYVDFDAKLYIR